MVAGRAGPLRLQAGSVRATAKSSSPHLTPLLRHTYATTLARRRVPIEVISRNLGHSDVTITLPVYRHVLDAERDEYLVDPFEQQQPPLPLEVGSMTPLEDEEDAWVEGCQEAAD
ncbi:tyrosine-type recombinase/integrase [Deinococcus metallilatus]|nr:tyrosine-type recombinase/integrase [Deinococcus metallilatus]GMA14463.1 hypothetical protein GCM10025871_07940 [Deinococcus metallilatus]